MSEESSVTELFAQAQLHHLRRIANDDHYELSDAAQRQLDKEVLLATARIEALSPGLLARLDEVKRLAPAFDFRVYRPVQGYNVICTNIPIGDNRRVPARASYPFGADGYCCQLLVSEGTDKAAKGEILFGHLGAFRSDFFLTGASSSSGGMPEQDQFIYDLCSVLHARDMAPIPAGQSRYCTPQCAA